MRNPEKIIFVVLVFISIVFLLWAASHADGYDAPTPGHSAALDHQWRVDEGSGQRADFRASRSMSRMSVLPRIVPKKQHLGSPEEPTTTLAPKSVKPKKHHHSSPKGFTAWIKDNFTIKVYMCESHGNPNAVNPSGKYRGKWQFNISTWLSNGGGEYAHDPVDASGAEQDVIAYNTYLRRGWSPWTCAKLV